MGLIGRLCDRLAAARLAHGSTLLDNAAIFYGNDNGSFHHDMDKTNWPSLVLGTAGGALKADGRYLRFAPSSCKGSSEAGTGTMNDLFCSLATAVGAPITTFGLGGVNRVRGPLPLLMT
jgi:hypothetical protein